MPLSLRPQLSQIQSLLEVHGEIYQANRIEAALNGGDDAMWEFLTSNELWGGAGSIADQALLDTGSRGEARCELEALLVGLGEMQLADGRTNVRTEMWTSVFRSWRAQGI